MIRHQSLYHPDIPIFLIAIPFINAFNYYFTYSDIRFDGFFLLTFSIDTAQGYLAWWIVRAVILRLDEGVPYLPKIWKRIGIQTVLTTLIGLAVIALTTELVSLIAKGAFAPLSFYTQDLVLISVWFLVINGVYIGIYFYRQWEAVASAKPSDLPEASGLLVRKGRHSRLIPFEEIALLYVMDDYVHLQDINGDRYVLDQSLSAIGKQLPNAYFFRLNRQCTVHRQLVNGFHRIEHGKLILELSTGAELPFTPTVSRLKAPAFKQWFSQI